MVTISATLAFDQLIKAGYDAEATCPHCGADWRYMGASVNAGQLAFRMKHEGSPACFETGVEYLHIKVEVYS